MACRNIYKKAQTDESRLGLSCLGYSSFLSCFGGKKIVLLSTFLITPLKKILQKTLVFDAKKLYTHACGVITSDWGGRGVYPSNTALAMNNTIVLRDL